MANIFTDTFEANNFDLWTATGNSPEIAAAQDGMEGSYCLECYSDAYVSKDLAVNEYYLAFKWRSSYAPAANYSGELCSFWNGASELARVNRNLASHFLEITRGSTLLATGTTELLYGYTYDIEVHYKPLNSGGAFQVKVDGVLDIDYSGDTTDGAEDLTSFRLGGVAAGGRLCYAYFDNVKVDDAYWVDSYYDYVGQIPLTFTPQAETYGSHSYEGQIPLTFIPQAETHGSHFYVGQIPLTFTPQAETHGSDFYVGQIPLTFTPQALSGIDSKYEGLILHRLIPIADYEPVPAGSSTTIPASTGGWAMGGAGVWVSSTPASDTIPEIDVTTGLPTVSLTGFVFGGGTTEVGEAEAVSTFPQADEIVADDEGGFVLCAPQVPEVTGGAATTFPASEVIEAEVGFKLGGTGVWDQVAPADLPSDVLVSTGGFVLSGTGFSLDPGVVPTATVIVPTGGFVLGDRRPDPVEVTYPDDLDRMIISTGGWEFGGDEGVLKSISPATLIESAGAIFLLSGAGLATSKFPPVAVIPGDGLGGWILGGPDAAEVYECWVIGGQSFEPACWSNFAFNSFAVRGDKSYAAGDLGIYVLGADTDNGEPIQSGVRIGKVNFGSAGTKRIRGVVFGQEAGGQTRVRVRTDEAEAVFAPERDLDRVVVSRDLQSSEFIVDLMDFKELSHLEITPLRLARR